MTPRFSSVDESFRLLVPFHRPGSGRHRLRVIAIGLLGLALLGAIITG